MDNTKPAAGSAFAAAALTVIGIAMVIVGIVTDDNPQVFTLGCFVLTAGLIGGFIVSAVRTVFSRSQPPASLGTPHPPVPLVGGPPPAHQPPQPYGHQPM